MVPLRERPKGTGAYPCPNCRHLISPENHTCFNCQEERKTQRALMIKQLTSGGRPFFIIAFLVALAMALYVMLYAG